MKGAAVAVLQFLATKLLPSLPRAGASSALPDSWTNVELQRDMDCGFWCPGAPLRNKKVYRMPTREGDASAAESCDKRRQGHPTLMPGVFSVWCPHGICLAFHVMRVPESPETAFSILALRRRTAPAVVVYDDACKLLAYALAREPEYFGRTRFFCDRFHRRDHVACGDGLDIDAFSAYACLNTEAAEQGWAKTCFVVTPTQFMTAPNFMLYVRTFFAGYNLDKMRECEKKRQLHVNHMANFVNPLRALSDHDRHTLLPAAAEQQP